MTHEIHFGPTVSVQWPSRFVSEPLTANSPVPFVVERETRDAAPEAATEDA